MHFIERVLSRRAPRPGTVAYSCEFYADGVAPRKMRTAYNELEDDIYDEGERSYSDDNGRTWSEPEPFVMSEKRAAGTLRRLESTGTIDPHNRRLVTLVMEGLLKNDNALDGMTTWFLKYRVSADGGRRVVHEEQIIQRGAQYTAEHPLEPVYIGRNNLMRGAENCILGTAGGRLLVALQMTPLGPDGTYYNPIGTHSFTDVVVLEGRWQSDERIEWELNAHLTIDPELSTRGLIEPTLARLQDGRILMVMRGSNEMRKERTGTKWQSVSCDEGRSWSAAQPWRYDDGSEVTSPSSICQLLAHSNGKIYWIGNLCDRPYANGPRYPLFIGEVDAGGLLRRATLCQIDGLSEGEDASLCLSNFCAHEDRGSGNIVMHMTRTFATGGVMSGDSYRYTIGVD